MGICASASSQSRTRTTTKATAATATGKGGAAESFRRPSAILLMDLEGRTKEYKHRITARAITSQNPSHFLCNSESMCIGTCMPRVPDEEELQPGRIYFLVPLSQSHTPLSLPLLCDLAIKASSALNR